MRWLGELPALGPVSPRLAADWPWDNSLSWPWDNLVELYEGFAGFLNQSPNRGHSCTLAACSWSSVLPKCRRAADQSGVTR